MKPLSIIHFGDIHIWRAQFEWSDPFYLKRYTGGLNLLLKRRKKFPPSVGEQIVSDILEQEADLVIFTGDMTTASNKEEFKACAELFQPIHEKWGDRFFVIPGNHDRYTNKSVNEDWYAEAFPYGKIKGVRVLELENDMVVVGIDASRAFLLRSNGWYDEKIDQQLRCELEKHSGKRLIVACHYPVDYPEGVKIQVEHKLLNRELLRKTLDEYQPVLYLHGHKHIRWKLGNKLNCGSAGMISSEKNKQAGYLKCTLSESLEQVYARYLNHTGEMNEYLLG